MNEHCSILDLSSLKSLIVALLVLATAAQGRTQAPLESYITEGLAKNREIRQQQFALEKSLHALKEARALFYPNVSLRTDYFLADGGRTIDFPVGDIVNPIYNGLNALTNSTAFPQIDNVSEQLNPNNFYDARLRTTLPIVNLELEYNRRIKKQEVVLQELEVDLYRRELIKEIKLAYYGYLQALGAIGILQDALRMAEENQRVNASLFANDRVNRTAVLRSEDEVRRFAAQVEVAQQREATARAYFNFLLDRDATEAILPPPLLSVPGAVALGEPTVNAREELKKLEIAERINDDLLGLSRASMVPQLNTFIDLGSQGFDGRFDNDTRYYFFGAALQWELFAAGKNRQRVQQAQLDQEITRSRMDHLRAQLELQVLSAENAFRSALALHDATLAQERSAERYHADMQKLYTEGQALFIELLDAQNQWVKNQLETNISLYELWIKATEIERANASITLQ